MFKNNWTYDDLLPSLFTFSIAYSVLPFHLVYVLQFLHLSFFVFDVLSQAFAKCSRNAFYTHTHTHTQHTYILLLFSLSVMSESLRPHGLQHSRLLCPSLSPRACSDSWALGWWCHPTFSSSVTRFPSCPQSFPTSGSVSVSGLFSSGGSSIGAWASASVLSMNIQGWFPLGLTGLISLLSKTHQEAL